ncbi:S24 family peptidase [Moritella viscosa]|uniref:S24 family peptidase n=1 Tax=Moritella viscosa TaxID=80854 RepID=UPI000918CEE4|nr:S24 family peptidase [Moritella viscosa]SGZ09635.1 Putative phage repressor [Moritella viscosa]
MEQISDRIKQLRTRNNMTQAQLAKKIGVTSVTVSKWELETAKPKSESAIRICKLFDVNIEWLNYGGEDNRVFNDSDLIAIPYFPDISNMIYTNGNISSENVNDEHIVHRKLFNKKIKHLKDVICLKIEGDSMEPRFLDQSLVFVDLSNKKVVDGSVYLVSHDNMLRVKLLEKIPTGFLIKSVNKSYSTIPIITQDVSFYIVGKVVMQLSFY